MLNILLLLVAVLAVVTHRQTLRQVAVAVVAVLEQPPILLLQLVQTWQ
jgi:hypothetical protein